MLVLPEALKSRIAAHGERGYPEEICGVMIGVDSDDRRVVERLIEIENVMGENRERRYLIEPRELMKIERDADESGKLVLGFYHTHPDHPSRPSGTDLDWAWPFYSYVIQSVRQGKAETLTSWRLAEEKKEFVEEEIAEK